MAPWLWGLEHLPSCAHSKCAVLPPSQQTLMWNCTCQALNLIVLFGSLHEIRVAFPILWIGKLRLVVTEPVSGGAGPGTQSRSLMPALHPCFLRGWSP